MTLQENKNTGYIHVEPADNFFGADSQIAYQPRNTIRNWIQFLTPGERQSGSIDAEDCVSFAKAQDINAQVDWLIASGLIRTEDLQKITDLGFVVNGKFSCSPRFIAKVSNTTPQGNSFPNVANAVQSCGLLPEADLPSDPLTMTWDEYYRPLTQVELDKAKKILAILSFPWHNVLIKDISLALQMAPVQIATAVCPGWNTDDPVKVCVQPCQHSTLVYDIDDQTKAYKVLDHYLPFLKDLASNYQIYAAMQTVVSPVVPVGPSPVPAPVGTPDTKHVFNQNLKQGDQGIEVAYVQKALENDGETMASLDIPGEYGEATRRAVFTFQLKYQVASLWDIIWLRGRQVGPHTRAKLNQVVSGSTGAVSLNSLPMILQKILSFGSAGDSSSGQLNATDWKHVVRHLVIVAASAALASVGASFLNDVLPAVLLHLPPAVAALGLTPLISSAAESLLRMATDYVNQLDQQ